MPIPTKRPVVDDLEKILGKALPVLDHGFVRVVDYMGDDAAIVQAARVSYGQGTKSARSDAGLIGYLMRHSHSTPFEMCEIKLHVKLPIFVARQWIRHRTANVNEYSARYSVLDREFYIPQPEHLAAQSRDNRQGRGAVLSGTEAERVLAILKKDSAQCYEHYEEMLNEADGAVVDVQKQGLTRELARINLPLNVYTQWYWKIDLHNLMHFLRLRGEGHAQYEIRAYADVMLGIVKRWVPVAYEAFENYILHGIQFSENEFTIVRNLIEGKPLPPQEQSGLPRGEYREFLEKLKK